MSSSSPPSRDSVNRFVGWVHFFLSLAAFPVLAALADGQWFVRDDWAVLAGRVPDGPLGLFAPLTDHLIATPAMLFRVVFASVGFEDYAPYLALSIAAHILAVHLLTRVLMRTGSSPAVALTVGSALLVSPLAAEQVLHAVNVSFGLATAMAMGAVLCLSPREPELDLSRWRQVSAGLLLILATTSTTFGLILTVLVAVWLFSVRGLRQTAVVVSPALVYWLLWRILAAGMFSTTADPVGDSESARLFGTELVGETVKTVTGLDVSIGGWVLGVLALLGVLAAWRERRQMGVLVLLLAGAAPVLLVVTSLQRGVSPTTANPAPRYQYMLVTLLLPLLALGASWVLQRIPTAELLVVGALVLSSIVPTGLEALEGEARVQAVSEQALRRRVAAAVAIAQRSEIDPMLRVDPGAVPTLRYEHLEHWIGDGSMPFEKPYFWPSDRLAIEAFVQLQIVEPEPIRTAVLHAVWGSEIVPDDLGCVEASTGTTLLITTSESAALRITPIDADSATVRATITDRRTGVRGSSAWLGLIFGEVSLSISRDDALVHLRPGLDDRIRVCGLTPVNV